MKNRKIKLLESWGEICGDLSNPSKGVIYALDMNSDKVYMALYEQVSRLIELYHNDDIVFIEVYEEDEYGTHEQRADRL